MLRALDAFELKDKGIILYCKDDSFENMSKSEVKDYLSRINKIKISDKNLNVKEFNIKNYDVMNSLSNKISVALLIDKTINNDDISIPSDITVINY